MLKPDGAFILVDIVYSFSPEEANRESGSGGRRHRGLVLP